MRATLPPCFGPKAFLRRVSSVPGLQGLPSQAGDVVDNVHRCLPSFLALLPHHGHTAKASPGKPGSCHRQKPCTPASQCGREPFPRCTHGFAAGPESQAAAPRQIGPADPRAAAPGWPSRAARSLPLGHGKRGNPLLAANGIVTTHPSRSSISRTCGMAATSFDPLLDLHLGQKHLAGCLQGAHKLHGPLARTAVPRAPQRLAVHGHKLP